MFCFLVDFIYIIISSWPKGGGFFFLKVGMKAHCCWIRVSPPVCLGPAFMHLIQSDQWPSLKFEGNSTRQLLQSVWFKKKDALTSMKSQNWTIHNHNFWNMMSLIWTGTHVNVLSKKNGLNMGHQTFLIMLSGFSVDFPGVMEL